MLKQDLINILTPRQREYDYSLLPDTFTYKDKLPILCHCCDSLGKEHGLFTHTIGQLKRGDGCPKCNGKYMSKELFIAEAKKIHGEEAYNYDKFVFINKKTKGIIHCNKHNIDFEQTPQKHLQGHGCPKCRYEKSALSKTHTNEWFLNKAKEIHSNKYDYSKSEYTKGYEKIEIICHEKDEYGNEHGSFWMTPDNHLHKTNPQGCPKCARNRTNNAQRDTLQNFIYKAKLIHGDKYDYSKVEYINNSTKVCILCPEHGEFLQTPSNHLLGQGCPRCAKIISNGETEIYDFCCNILGKNNIKQRVRNILSENKELDIYIPSKNIAIEYDGLIWHSEKFNRDNNYHLKKTNECKNKGIRLIHIFEDEWLEHADIIKSMLKNILEYTEIRIFARKCIVKDVSTNEAMQFLDKNHIQGRCKAKYYYGLFYNDELVSLMTFGYTRQQRKYNKDYNNTYELLRFCNKLNTNVIGGASKLLKHFIDDIKPNEIITYADKRWSIGNLYETLGFVHTHDSRPNYFYTFGQKRENRFKYRKGQLIKQGFDKNKTEHEIMLERGIYRIYDCGTMVYKLNFK